MLIEEEAVVNVRFMYYVSVSAVPRGCVDLGAGCFMLRNEEIVECT